VIAEYFAEHFMPNILHLTPATLCGMMAGLTQGEGIKA
jgi:hypothetical protein